MKRYWNGFIDRKGRIYFVPFWGIFMPGILKLLLKILSGLPSSIGLFNLYNPSTHHQDIDIKWNMINLIIWESPKHSHLDLNLSM